MSSLFLLDRVSHSVSFAESPDPSSTIWLDFQMLDLPLLKFGTISNIPMDELSYHMKNDIGVSLRAIEKNDPRVLISSGRACLVHCELLLQNEWTGKVVMVNERDNQHYDAMAASDFGFVYDGQMVSSANALHLPVNCMIQMRMNQQWMHDFFNKWWNDMNIIADNQVN